MASDARMAATPLTDILEVLPLWKRGVTRLDEYARRALEREAQGRGWWPFSFELLDQLPDDLDEFHESLLERLYRAIVAGPGVYKITERDRFSELDDEVVARVRQMPAGHDVVVHDMGVSSGITSMTLFQKLSSERSVRMFASDYYDAIFVVDTDESGWKGIFDREGKLLQVVSRRLVLSGYRTELARHPLNRLAQIWAKRRIVPAMQGAVLRAMSKGAHEVPGWRIREVKLFHPEVLRLASQSDRFRLLRHSVFDPNPVDADIIRLMNVLTPHHFPEAQVLHGLRQSMGRLCEGGLLIIGRTTDPPDAQTRASIYRREGGRLEEVAAMGGGYEWPGIVKRAGQT